MAPLYWALAADSQHGRAPDPFNAEVETFFGFSSLMSWIRDAYTSDLDFSPSGINALLDELHRQLDEVDKSLYEHLVCVTASYHHCDSFSVPLLCLTHSISTGKAQREATILCTSMVHDAVFSRVCLARCKALL